jgi:hypothetical protein
MTDSNITGSRILLRSCASSAIGSSVAVSSDFQFSVEGGMAAGQVKLTALNFIKCVM